MRRNTFLPGAVALFLLALLVAALAPAGPDDAATSAIGRAVPFMLQTIVAGLFYLVMLAPLWMRSDPESDQWRSLPVLLSSFAAAAFLSLALRSLAGGQPVNVYGLLETLLLIAALGLFAAALLARPVEESEPAGWTPASAPPRPAPPAPWERQQVHRVPADDAVVLSEEQVDDDEDEMEDEDELEELRRELVILVGGSEAMTDRLIRHEEQRTPGLAPEEYVRRAIASLEHDRRW